jgi:predicted ribosome quality control (RQC) complex YloA/Tae2 family protein
MLLLLLLASSVTSGVALHPQRCAATRHAFNSRCRQPRAATTEDAVHERRLLRGVLSEALTVQARKRSGLLTQESVEVVEPADPADTKAAKAYAKAVRRAAQLPQRLAEVDEAERLLTSIGARLNERGAALEPIRRELEGLGLGARLQSFDVEKHALAQVGRPEGFDGLVIESPRGVPILVARQKFSDELLRRIGRGTDLWFQAQGGRGSRVLLRTSMCRGLSRSSRECMETAADLAAYFSDWKRATESVDVMYTDSRHVAKRGSRVGQMKGGKRLGTIRACPWRVAEAALEAQEEQGWL